MELYVKEQLVFFSGFMQILSLVQNSTFTKNGKTFIASTYCRYSFIVFTLF